MNTDNIILVLILITLCSYVVRNSSIRYNVRYISLIIFFLFLHTLGILVSERKNFVPFLYTYGGVICAFITYLIWFIKKRRKKISDYLKIIWFLIFSFSYLYSYTNYNSLSSERGPHVLAGLNNSFSHLEIFRLQYLYITIIAIISLLIYVEKNYNRIERNNYLE